MRGSIMMNSARFGVAPPSEKSDRSGDQTAPNWRAGRTFGEIPDGDRWDSPPKIRFAPDSPPEEAGFELPVP
jgi:hypothetical protein